MKQLNLQYLYESLVAEHEIKGPEQNSLLPVSATNDS